MKNNKLNFVDFETLSITKTGTQQIRGGETYTLEGTGGGGTTQTTADFRRDSDGRYACGVPDSVTIAQLDFWTTWE